MVSTVSVDVWAAVPLRATEVGFRVHVGTSLAPVIDVVTAHVRSTVPLNPYVPTTLMVAVFPVVAPGETDKLWLPVPGLAPKPGSFVIVSATVVFAVSDPEVPVMVTVTGLEVTAADVLTVRVSTSVSDAVPAAKLDVTPEGNPEAVNETVPVNPFAGAMVTVLVPVAPCAIDTLVGEAESVKLGAGVTVTAPVPDALL